MKRIIILLPVLLLVNLSFSQENTEIIWWNPATSEFPVIAGQAWPDEAQTIYHRLPARAENDVREAVWNLSKHSAGLSIRFWSNASSILVKYKVKGTVAMKHMPATGVSGVDLYSKSKDGKWLRCWGSYSIDTVINYNFIIDESAESYKTYGREYQLFLPLYNELETLEIGVHETTFLEALPLRKEKPVVAYGTSICQGACVSRPGMAWTNILERRLERPVINLGFSGNGRMEPELIDLMSEIEARVYILDCLPNINPGRDDAYTLIVESVKNLKELRPDVPVILTAHIGYADGLTNKKRRDEYLELNKELDRAYDSLKTKGITDVFLLDKEKMGLDMDMYVDRIHPNDYGMVQYANAYEDLIREILAEPEGELSTTIPHTQSRDIAVYKWEDRHQALLDLNKVDPPKICLFGNSIVNFWGGEPASSIARGQDSWEQLIESQGVRNFGFGWDRIENVLWRVYHDELDGFEAEQIVLMIGTNNLHLNSENEIIEGLGELIEAIRIRQAESSILLMGILPRRGKEEMIRTINLKISQLADLKTIKYRDIGSPLLLENGALNESLFTDGLHPNAEGYMLLAEELHQILKEK